ncbi:NAD(P)H-dependent oxidoreductase, partial [Candidatus Woesearchaeota archaeon]|nr:NAD(P)H-dependent oxidoreductase [Candidatus Woesearchaeota archaeon]
MKTLIVYSHPNKKGHCGHILRQVEENFKKNKV